MNLESLHSFRDELEKLSGSATPLVSAGRFLARHRHVTSAAVGAGVGAGLGAAQAPEGDRLHGAIRGAALGAGLGAGGSIAQRAVHDTRLLSGSPLTTGQALTGTARRFGEGFNRFVKRQVHGITGAYANPAQTGIHSSVVAAEKSDLVKRRLADQLKSVANPEYAKHLQDVAHAEIQKLVEEGVRGDRALKAGVTSLPGVIRGLASGKTRRGTAVALGHALTGGKLVSTGGALGVGLPLTLGAADVAKGDESATGGKTKMQKVLNTGSYVGAGVLTAGLPVGAQILAYSGVDELGRRIIGHKWSKKPSVLGLTQNAIGEVQ